MQALTEAGVAVYALSYDEQDALTEFAAAHGITYRLLSDPDSQVIRQFGILNTLIAEDDHPWFGIPFPGTYVLDAAGTITHKFFDNNLAVRVGPEQLLAAVRGETLELDAAEAVQSTEVNVFLDADHLAVSVLSVLVAHFQVPADRHLYADPAPSGCIAASLELDDHPNVVQRDLQRPASQPHQLADSDETFNVHHGIVELRLPITINTALTQKSQAEPITLTGKVRWQTCDDTVCDVPTSQPFELLVQTVGSVLPGLIGGDSSREPNAAKHFQHMTERRKSSDVR